MIRKSLSKKNHQKHIKWRSHEILRIEGFSDAVFAFAMTLLVVSLEVPKTYAEMKHGLSGMIGFGICFVFLFLIWHEQYVFFRQFHLKDIRTIVLNGLLLFVVLFYVYPLKFLFTLLTQGNDFEEHGVIMNRIQNSGEIRELMVLYCAGYSLVYFVLFLLYLNAYKQKDSIGLNPIECFHTRTEMYKHLTLISIGLFVLILSISVPLEYSGITGMTFMIIGPVLSILFSYRGSRMKKVFSNEEILAHEIYLQAEE